MKTSFLILLATAGLSLAACSQRLSARETPALVKNALKARFPEATAVEWEKEKELFEAEFRQAEQEYAVLIDAAGKIQIIKQDLSPEVLPAAVADAIRKDHPEYQVEDVESLEKNGRQFYQVELEKGRREQQLVFNVDGRLAPDISYWD